MSDPDFKNYRARVAFFNATGRCADAYHGHLFAKDPAQSGDISKSFKNNLDNIDNCGTSIDEFVSTIVFDGIQVTWGAILVDHVPVPEGASQAEAQNYGGAFLKWYNGESIINWRYSVINGAQKLSLVVLREDIEKENEKDKFTTDITEVYRVLALDEINRYYQQVFTKDDKTENGFLASDPIYPQIKGKYFDYIPLFTCPGEEPEKSMLLDLAYENIGHYQKTAEQENGLYLTSFATPCAVNMEQLLKSENKQTGEKTYHTITLSPSRFLFFAQKNEDGTFTNVDVKFLEFTGAGLSQITIALNNCLDRMAKLGVQAIGAEKRGVETAEVAKIRRASENGVLGAFGRSMSNKVTQAVRLMAKWNLIPDEEADSWSYQLNSDFNVEQMSAQILSIMHNARQSNEITKETWLNSLKKAGLVAEDVSINDYINALQNDDNALSHGASGD